MTPVEQIDLVVFSVAGVRFAADLGQVRRVDFDDPGETVGQPLGPPTHGRRALVFNASEGHERRLAVDEVFGVSRVPVDTLRRLPAAVRAAPFSVGAWLDGDLPVLLVDLLAMVPAT